MNINEIGYTVCRILDPDDDKKYRDKMIFAHGTNDNDKKMTEFNKLQLEDKKLKFQHMPDKHSDRDVLYICGRSGSGKSYYLSKYVKEYKKMFPKNKVYLFSRKLEDDNLDKEIDKRVFIDKTIIDEPFEVELFENSLVIFDDTDVLPDDLKKSVNHLRDQILEIGRSLKISCIITNHLCTSPDLKRVLNECHSATIFPANINRQMVYFLENYCGLDKEDIKDIKKCNSRSATIFLKYPPVIMTEKKVWLLSGDE